MRAPLVDHVIGIASAVLLSAIAIALLRRQAYRLFPCFFCYTVFHMLQTLIDESLSITMGINRTYIWTFYSLQTVSLALSFAVIYELFTSVMEPYEALKYVGKKLFLVAALSLLAAAVLLVILGNGPGLNRLAYVIFVTVRSLRIVQLGLLLSLFLAARSLGLSWRSYSFGIAMGYGLYAAVDLVMAAVRTEFGEGIWHLHSLMTTAAFTGMLLIWLFYILQRQTVAQPVRIIPQSNIEKWNQALEEILRRKSA